MRPIWLAAVSLLGLGCTDGISSYRDYSLRQSQFACEVQLRCCGASKCSSSMDLTFNASIKDTQYALDQGLLVFNADAANTCYQAAVQAYANCDLPLADLDKTGSPAAVAACKIVLQGTLPLGAACTSSTYCAPPSSCSLPAGATDGIMRCQRAVSVGQDCSKFPCGDGSNCDPTSKICVAPVLNGSLGDTCESIPPSPPAMSTLPPCRSPFVCLANNTCGLAQDGGAACNGKTTSNPQCLSGTCDRMFCTAPMTKPKTVRDSICSGAVVGGP